MEIINFSQLTFWVSNSKQASNYFITRYGFNPVKHFEDNHIIRDVCKLNDIVFIFESPSIYPLEEMTKFLLKHGDGVKDIAFQVNDCNYIYAQAIKRGAESISPPKYIDDTIQSTIQTVTDITHTFIQGKVVHSESIDPINKTLPSINLYRIDHIVTNTDDMKTNVEWYEEILQFKQFWSVDETIIHTQYSALRSTVMTNETETIKLPINEPAPGLRKSQIQEFLEYNHGSGIQHIALTTSNIIDTVRDLKERGVEFLDIPEKYYDKLESRLRLSNRQIDTDMEMLKQLKILLDFDENGYLLQIFTKPVMSKPTLFIEVIERHNFDGFGAGNFQSLFECIEIEQIRREKLDFLLINK